MTFWEWIRQPRYTKLEQELAREVDYLKAKLESEHNKVIELLEKLAFPQAPVNPIPSSLMHIPPPESPIQAQARKLSSLSKQRLDAQILAMEQRANQISARDEEATRRANEETKAFPASEEKPS